MLMLVLSESTDWFTITFPPDPYLHGSGWGEGGRYSPIEVTGLLDVPFRGSNLWTGTA